MKLFINKNCKYIKGVKNAAIYDLKSQEVYAINEVGKYTLDKFLNDENYIGTPDEKDFIESLIKSDLLSRTPFEDINTSIKPEITIKYAWLELTGSCNLKCIHCYGAFGNSNTCKNNTMSIKDWKYVIDNLVKLKCTDIQLIGGEPMAYSGFFEILEYAHKSGMKRIDVFTNATFINEDNIKKLKDNGASIRISLYGHNDQTHEKITGIKGSFDKTQNALKLLKKYQIPSSIAVIIMKENENELLDIKEYIKSLGYKYTGFDVIRPSSKNDTVNSHKISNVELLKERYNTYPTFTISERQFEMNHWYNSCWNSKLAITSNGDVIPCIFERDNIVGNIRECDFQTILKNIDKIWSITKDKIDVCKDCEFRYACHDCRPIAKGINNSLYAKYPRCCYNPYKGIWEDIEICTKELQ